MNYLTFLRTNARWLAGGFLLTAFSGFGQTFFIALSSGHLRAEFGLSHGDFGLLYMAATLCSAVCLPWVGRSVDVFPVRIVAVATCLSLGAFCLAMSLVNSVAVLFLTIFGLRLSGQGMMTHVSMSAMGRWYSAHRGRAVSVAQMGFPVAESLFPASFVICSALIGWRQSWAAGAGLLLFGAIPVVLLLFARERTPQSGDTSAPHESGRQWTRAEVLRDPLFWVIAAGVCAPPFIGTAILFNQVYLAELRNWPLELFASAFVVMAAAGVITSLSLGPVIDRQSAKALLPAMLLPLCAGCMILAVFTAAPVAYIFMAFLGMSSGFAAVLMGALWPELYGVRHIGAIRSVSFALMVFASAAGPGLAGVLIDAGVAFEHQLLAMAGYGAAMTAVLFLVRHKLQER